jgi:hypothetical protein
LSGRVSRELDIVELPKSFEIDPEGLAELTQQSEQMNEAVELLYPGLRQAVYEDVVREIRPVAKSALQRLQYLQ